MDGPGAGVRCRADTSVDPTGRRVDRGVAALTVRVIAAGRTDPNRDLRFGSEELQLDETGRRDCRRLVERLGDPVAGYDIAFCGPEASVIGTAELLGVRAPADPRLRSLDLGRWRGRPPEEIPMDDLREWFTDVAAAPHGGESIATFVARVGQWFDTDLATAHAAAEVTAVVVVAMPVVQALVAHVGLAGPDDFWSIAIEPASERVLTLPVDSGEDRCHSGEQK